MNAQWVGVMEMLSPRRCSHPDYQYLACKVCNMTFYLPIDEQRRTKDALQRLISHKCMEQTNGVAA
jgi:hypothetical protein